MRPPVSGGKNTPDLTHSRFIGALPPSVANSRDRNSDKLLDGLFEGTMEVIARPERQAKYFQTTGSFDFMWDGTKMGG